MGRGPPSYLRSGWDGSFYASPVTLKKSILRGLPQYLTFALIFLKSGFIPAISNPLSGTSCRLIHSLLGSREQLKPLFPSPSFLPSWS